MDAREEFADAETLHVCGKQVCRLAIPDDPDHQTVVGLRKKYDEYMSRVNDSKYPDEYKLDATYKAFILGILLEKGAINTSELSDAIKQKYPGSFDPQAFRDAVQTIDDYIQKGRSNLKRLPRPNKPNPEPQEERRGFAQRMWDCLTRKKKG
ncbi:MAG: hypothetical protein K9M03_04915 [Kiritimatiellales bacterium]|nr:hypothetical protein [Kiritimatiellales bacterium]